MNILVIGGTAFLGRTFVEAALARGHALTLLNRGQRNPGLFPQVEHIQGDRTKDLHLLEGRSWDAVLDTCGYFPRVVRMSAEALKGRVGQYCFISSISVYSDLSEPPNETSPVGQIEDITVEEITGETYGPLKALCEEVVRSVYGSHALIVRPGLIVGPHDPTDRFTYWPLRFARGGEILAPDQKDQPVQIIDVRDLAEWLVSLLERNVGGTFNATSPAHPYLWAEFLQIVQSAVGHEGTIRWVPGDFLREHSVEPWSDLPVALPYDGEAWNMSRTDVSAAVAAGLTFRPLDITTRETLAWALDRGEVELKAGLTAERERQLLEAYRARD